MPNLRVSNPQSGIKLVITAGDVFGRLTVLREAEPVQRYSHNGSKNGKRRMFECRCWCGIISTVDLSHLRCGHSRSCECLQAEITAIRNYRHGKTGTDEYVTWQSMISRCEDPTGPNAAYLGISVCEEWRNDFTAFYGHVGPRPSKSHSIDRYPDTQGDYGPGNVRWATTDQQQRNKRNTVRLEYGGVLIPLVDVAIQTGVAASSLRDRVSRGIVGPRLFEKKLKRSCWKLGADALVR